MPPRWRRSQEFSYRLRGFLITASIVFMQHNSADAANLLQAEEKSASSGNKYLIIHAGKSKAEFELTRPNQIDSSILLCIPAAFTSQQGGICGLYASRGSIGNKDAIDKGMSGAIEIKDGICKIIDTKSGAFLNAVFVEKLKSDKSSFFQQFQIVKNGHAESFRDKTHCQRRCIATYSDGNTVVIESKGSVSFAEFGNDLVDLGVQEALYTDMGPWSAGWYRNGQGKPIMIGESRAMTHKQTNWFVLTSPGK